MDDVQYKCNDCHIFINVEDVEFEGENRTPRCPVCKEEIEKACPNDHCHCSHPITESIAYCRLCGKAMCPQCYSHDVEQISRVTGYLQAVEGWNAAKQQELKDRTRTENKEIFAMAT
jgi:hypothetical protein